MGLIVRIWALVLLVFALHAVVFISGLKIGHNESLFVTINYVAFVVMLLLLLYALLDCRRRDVSQFPPLKYGDREFPPEVMRRIWTWGLLLSFVLGLAMPLKVGSTGGIMSIGGLDLSSDVTLSDVTFYVIWPVVLSSKGYGIKGHMFFQEVYLQIPLMFIVGLYLYFRGVVRRVSEN